MDISGVFIFNSKPQNGATAKLWKSSAFPTTPPAQDDDEPNVSYQVGSTLTTSVQYGSDGAFRWNSVASDSYYVSVEYDNHRAWLFVGHVDVSQILTTQGDMLIRGSSGLERKAKGTADGQKFRMISGVPTWG
jgi:hypothetical protein